MRQRMAVGLDVHAKSVVAAALDTETGEVFNRRLDPVPAEIAQWIFGLPGDSAVTYESGPTGFGLARFLNSAGIQTVVAASSMLQRPAGDRVKTDKRDALHLARLLKLDEITAVTIPSETAEAARDLFRAREDARTDLMSARHRLSKLLLRQGIVYPGKTTWNRDHDRWLDKQAFTEIPRQHAYAAYRDAVASCEMRRMRLDDVLEQLAADSEFTPVVRNLSCLRGISTLTAIGLAVEIGDWHRLSGRSIGAYLGLTASESSSGESRSQGPITRAGNSHVRRLLTEAAWHHRKDYNPQSQTLRARWALAGPDAVRRGDEGNRRLHKRWIALDARNLKSSKANTAIARELAGWCWSLAIMA